MDEKTRKLVEGAEERAGKASRGPWVRWKGHAQLMQGPAIHNNTERFLFAKATNECVCDCQNDYEPTFHCC